MTSPETGTGSDVEQNSTVSPSTNASSTSRAEADVFVMVTRSTSEWTTVLQCIRAFGGLVGKDHLLSNKAGNSSGAQGLRRPTVREKAKDQGKFMFTGLQNKVLLEVTDEQKALLMTSAGKALVFKFVDGGLQQGIYKLKVTNLIEYTKARRNTNEA